MNNLSQIVSQLEATFLSNSNQERTAALAYLNQQAGADVNFLKVLYQLLTSDLSNSHQNWKLIKISICNFIGKYVQKLATNLPLLNESRRTIVAILFQALDHSAINHRNKNMLSSAMGKLLTKQFNTPNEIGREIMAHTRLALQQGNFSLGAYLLHALLNSNKDFDFPVEIKKEILDLFAEQFCKVAKQAETETQENRTTHQSINMLDYGLEVLIIYLNRVKPAKYMQLTIQLLRQAYFCTIIMGVFSICPLSNSQVILSAQVPYADNINRLRTLAFGILLILLKNIKTAKSKITSYPHLEQLTKQLFLSICQRLPLQLQNSMVERNEYLFSRIIEFLDLFCIPSSNHEIVSVMAEDILLHIILPLLVIPPELHKKILSDPAEYISTLQQICYQKKEKSTMIMKGYKFIQTICSKIDGFLKSTTMMFLSMLEHCMDPSAENLQKLNPKLVDSMFYKLTTPSVKFETALLFLSSASYIVTHRKDLIGEIESVVSRYETMLMAIKQPPLVIAFSLFYCYYCDQLYKNPDQKPIFLKFFNYFCMLSSLPGQENKAIRAQAFNTIDNIIPLNSFKTNFSAQICQVGDQLLANQHGELENTIQLIQLLTKQYCHELSYQGNRVLAWLGVLQTKLDNPSHQRTDTIAFSRYLDLIAHIISVQEFYMFRDKAMEFFSPCFKLLDSKNQFSENVLGVVSTFIAQSHCVPQWTPKLVEQLVFMIKQDEVLSNQMFHLINIILIYIDKNNRQQVFKIYQIIMSGYNQQAEGDQIMESVLLCHLLVFYHHELLPEEMKAEIINRTVKMMLAQEINTNDRLFAKLILLILIFLKSQFEFTCLVLESNNDFLRTFYNLAYNDSKTYVEQYDYKVFVIIHTTIIDKHCNPLMVGYLQQIVTLIVQFLQKLYKIKQPVTMKHQDEQFGQSSDQERISHYNEDSKSLIERYQSPLKEIDQFNHFRNFFNRVKSEPARWDFFQGIITQLPQKQRRFLSTIALNIQKMVVDGQVKLRQIVKIKRPE